MVLLSSAAHDRLPGRSPSHALALGAPAKALPGEPPPPNDGSDADTPQAVATLCSRGAMPASRSACREGVSQAATPPTTTPSSQQAYLATFHVNRPGSVLSRPGPSELLELPNTSREFRVTPNQGAIPL